MPEENCMTTMVQILPQLKSKGYTCDFELKEGQLFCKGTNELFNPEDVVIERVYRFEGDSNPDDMAVLYGVRTVSGTKGTLIDAYGTYDDADLGNFLRHVKVEEIKD
jgi:hypothetical protein